MKCFDSLFIDAVHGRTGQIVGQLLSNDVQIIHAGPAGLRINTIFNLSRVSDDDHDRPSVIEGQEANVLQLGVEPLRRHDQGDVVRNPRQELGRRLKDFIDTAQLILKPGLDELLFRFRDLRRLEKAVDIEPIALQRRDSAGRRVRLFQISHHFQIEHLVADRRRTDAQIILTGNRP